MAVLMGITLSLAGMTLGILGVVVMAMVGNYTAMLWALGYTTLAATLLLTEKEA